LRTNICSTPPDNNIKLKETPKYCSLLTLNTKNFRIMNNFASFRRENEEEEEEGVEEEGWKG
jgi:hypothetical protein